jgi:cyclopropane fatty-acyl-phospholipid synthase-like methyltransferase
MTNPLRSLIGRLAPLIGFKTSGNYWETRYRLGGHSGQGSRGEAARYKAEVINGFLQQHGVQSMIEFGCGDGVQLGMFQVPRYTGVDVSQTIVAHCRKLYANDAGKQFMVLDDYRGESAQLAVSLDVIFHLVEDQVYDAYLQRLFDASTQYVIIYSTSVDMKATGTPHVRHRDCVADVAQRFPQFQRMHDAESALPAPVAFDRGHPTTFFLYQRAPTA